MKNVLYPNIPQKLTLNQQHHIFKVGDSVFIRPDAEKYFIDTTPSMRRSMGYWVKIIRIESVKHIYTNPSRLIKTEYEPDDLMIYTNTIDYPDGEFYWFYKCLVSKRNIPNYEPKQKIVRENIITYFEYFINKKEVI